ncbi:MAG: efflux RND transporter periplasmic adaptor subunit [Alsobacter sp.]
MRRPARAALILAVVLAAGAGGYWAGQRNLALPDRSWLHGLPRFAEAGPLPASDGPARGGPVVYYRDPDGRPFYSAVPKLTTDGRAFLAVHVEEDVSFDDKPEHKEAAAPSSSGGPKRVLYYRNPMGLPDTSPTPKKDSMGMDYIPVYEGDDGDGSAIRVAPGKLQRTGVRTETAIERVISDPVRVPGAVQLDERRVTVVATRADAFIDSVASVTTGDHVTKGQALLQLYSPEIAAASAQFLTDLGSSGRDVTKSGARQRLENFGVPPEAIAEMERTRKVPLSMTWRAPRDGIVLQRNAVEGMKAAPGDVLFRLADVSTVWVLADVPEYQLGAVRIGAPAVIRLRSRPGQTFKGVVALIYPQVTADTRTTKVRVEIPNPDGILLPDMYAEVEIAGGSGSQVVAVPDNAVIDTGRRQVVILDKGEGRFEPRQIQPGRQGGGFVEIRSGIAAGDKIVVAANFLIDAESNLKAALNAMTSADAAP